MLSFILECGTLTAGQQRPVGVADAGQHVGDRIVHSRISLSRFGYQLALVTPGISPLKAASRNVRREQPNLRR